jgi:ribonuclease R
MIGSKFKGIIKFKNRRNAYIEIDDKRYFIYKKNTNKSLNLDKVEVEIIEVNGKLEAKVIDIIQRNKVEFVVRIHKNKKVTFGIPDDSKLPDFFIKGNPDVEENDKVIIKMTSWNSKSPKAKVIKKLGKFGDNETEMNSIMFQYGLPMEFPEKVVNEAEGIPDQIDPREVFKRKDMRNVLTFTIDPEDARDFDDAISFQPLIDGYIEVGVHIADVSHYVKKGTELDKEAYKRATSVYLVDRCVPMLPERLSNGICSLNPNVDRFAFSVLFKFDKDLNLVDKWFGKTVIHSDKRFTYEQAQELIEGGDGELGYEVRKVNEISKKLKEKRMKEGSIEMNSKEVKFILEPNTKKPTGVYFKEQKEANNLIEELMLLANRSVSKLLTDKKWNNIYRIHDTPNEDKLFNLKSICKTFGYDISIEDDLKGSLNKLLKDIEGEPEQNMLQTLTTRCMSKATYSINNVGHYGLGFDHYSHFTSPIRRYPDLILHRLLETYLDRGKMKNPIDIEEDAKWCSSRELVAANAERDSIKYKQGEYLMDKVGNVYSGIISSITDWGVYVELTDTLCVGMVKIDKHWNVDLAKYEIEIMDRKLRLGDEIMVRVKSVELDKKQIDFEIIL